MIRIIEHTVDLEFPVGAGVHSLIAQIPCRLGREGRLFKLKDRALQEQRVFSVLETVARMPEEELLHFVFLPESSVPFDALDRVINTVSEDLPDNTVTVLGVEHITLQQFRKLLQRFAEDNRESLDAIIKESEGEDHAKPVNMCVTIVKERDGAVRCFLSAKTYPFAGEETVDCSFDLYQGKAFLLFTCRHVPFNFMPVICFDYVYRDLHHSNIMTIIEKTNEIYFKRHHHLDLLAVIQCNPKPEHKVFRDVVTGFYGEHLFKTPGTRETITVFVNTSSETELEGDPLVHAFGNSSIVAGMRHKLPRIKLSEFKTDDFSGAPVSRLRFGDATRLYTIRLFPHHETDPRSSRSMVKVTGVYRPGTVTGWEKMSGDELLTGISDDAGNPLNIF
ncbi:MAG: hypothetical protein P1S46_03960 [bacterium]|nr:hypothetical protein [bacterium]MDT8395372.1 hypothetical protein [bacterium]